jgi:hypothetical protein
MDFFVQDSSDIASGRMRRRENEAMNSAVQEHNQQIANNINTLKTNLTNNLSSLNESETLSEGVGAAKDLMGLGGIKDGFKEYQRWSQTRAPSKNQQMRQQLREEPVEPQDEGNVRIGDQPNAQPQTEVPENSTPSAPAEPTPEGTPATPSSNTAPTDAEHTAITAGEDDAGKSGSMLHNGIKAATGLSDDAIEKIGKGAGVAGAAITGGLDIYQDIKSHKIAGDNGWEQAGNVTEIAGSLADIAGAVPVLAPLAAVGGLLDLLGGGLDAIGEAVEGDKKKQEAQQQEQELEQKQKEQEEQETVVGQAPIAVAKVQ